MNIDLLKSFFMITSIYIFSSKIGKDLFNAKIECNLKSP
jgi:hypothetical protein